MILKNNRINRDDFEKIMKKGRLISQGLFSLRFIKNVENKGFLGWKTAVVVSKKIAKTAVLRNKIRRRAYSVLQKQAKMSKNPYFIILFAQKGSEKATFENQKNDILNILNKANIL